MIAIKGIKMPNDCIECDNMGLRYSLGCELIFNGCANCGRHPSCPLTEIVTCKNCEDWMRDVPSRVIDVKEYHFCPMVGFDTAEDYFCPDAERKE